MVHRYRAGVVPDAASEADPDAKRLTAARQRAPGLIDAALDGYDFRAAAAAAWEIVNAANRYLKQASPWQLARSERDDAGAAAKLDAVLPPRSAPAAAWPSSWPRSSPAPRPGSRRSAGRGSCPVPSRFSRGSSGGDAE